jgi:hypothetical protein
VSGADTRTAFPKLTTIGGSLYASGADTRTAFPKLTTIGGYLDVRGADTRTAFPKLTTIGGSLYASGADTKCQKLIRTNDAGAIGACRDALMKALAKNGLARHDGILSRIVSRKGSVLRVVIVGQSKVSYVIEKDGETAHGDTLRTARADLLLKLGKRDLSAFRKWNVDTQRPIEELIAAYRAITGACGAGVQHFLTGCQCPAKASVSQVLDATRGQYGHETFASFFTQLKS